MKKFLCLILAFSSIFVFTLFGCTNDKSKPISQNALIDYSNDMQITYLCSGGGSSIPATKSDTGYYYIGDDRIIIYIDSKTQKATPLCAKPDCMHNDPDTCDAYVNSSENISQDSLWGSLGTAIQYYQGYLYMVCGEYDKSMIEYNTYLMKMDKDGTNRQKVTDYFDSPFTNWFIHQGYFYYTSDSSVLRIPLTNPKSSPEEVYKAQHFIKDNENTYSSFCAYKNYIYFQVDELDEEGNGIGRQTICLNLDTMKKSFLKIGKNNASFSAFAGDSMIMYYSDGNEKVYVKADLEGNNCKNIFSQKSNEIQSITGDGTYYYFDNSFQVANGSSKEQKITVCDENLKEIDTFKLPNMDTKTYNFFAPQDENCFLFECFNEKDERCLVMADKSQIGTIGGNTIKFKELCKLKWADDKNNNDAVAR